MQELPNYSRGDVYGVSADDNNDDLQQQQEEKHHEEEQQQPTRGYNIGDEPPSIVNPNNNSNHRCTAIQSNPVCRALAWFYRPYYGDARHSLLCLLSHPLNFSLGIAVFVTIVTLLSLSVGLVVLACIGVVLFYITCEIGLAVAYTDVALSYYFCTPKQQQREQGFPKLAFTRGYPPNCACNHQFGQRIKFMATDCFIYRMFAYQMFVKLPVSVITSVSMFVVVAALALVVMPIWYLSNNYVFAQHWICLGYNMNCHTMDGCECRGISIDNFGATFVVMVVSLLLLLPLTLKCSNGAAAVNRNITLWCLTSNRDDGSSTALIGHPQQNVPIVVAAPSQKQIQSPDSYV